MLNEQDKKNILNSDSVEIIKILNRPSLSNGEVIYILKHIGHIKSIEYAECFFRLISNENEDIRFLALKNLGKLHLTNYINTFFEISKNDSCSNVRREAVSVIGRMRSFEAIPYLKKLLNDNDPNIICQAIRGLLIFKGDEAIDSLLKTFMNHENETVKSLVRKEYCTDKKKVERQKHLQFPQFIKNVVVKGDVIEVLKNIPDESVHLTFTSPPYYNARDYSIYPSYEGYLKFLNDVFESIIRVTKEGRFLIVNTSPVIVPRISRKYSSKRYAIPFDLHYFLQRMGWDFIDDIIWEKPEFSVKNRIGGFQQHRKPLAYKPNNITEYLMVYRKHSDKLLDWNIRQYPQDIVEKSKVKDGFESTNVWKISPQSDKVHSAIFPEDLCKRVISYYSYENDLVFDPFGGSGTLGKTALKMQRNFFLTEINDVYFEYMKKTFKEDLWSCNVKFYNLDEFNKIINDNREACY